MPTLCVIPAKGLSTRLAGKNILPFEGHPLIAHAIRKGQKSGLADTICVSSETPEIIDIAQRYGAETPFVRPRSLSVDPATIVDVCLHAVDWYAEHDSRNFDTIVVLLATSPLVRLEMITEAFNTFTKARGNSCLLSVSPTEQPPYTTQQISPQGYLVPLFPDSAYAQAKSNECPQAYHSNGCVAVANVAWLRQQNSFYVDDDRFHNPRLASIDIDTEEDYKIRRWRVAIRSCWIQDYSMNIPYSVGSAIERSGWPTLIRDGRYGPNSWRRYRACPPHRDQSRRVWGGRRKIQVVDYDLPMADRSATYTYATADGPREETLRDFRRFARTG